jgi:glycosyltransferase involved in cell wall biosynthesis
MRLPRYAGASTTRPIHVCDIEIGGGIAAVSGCRGYDEVRILVRLHGRPIDWITVRTPGDMIQPDIVEREILRHPSVLESALAADVIATKNAEIEWPPISVVVCTRDRPAELAPCLDSLLSLDYPAFELIVVDNASRSPDTRAVAEQRGVRCVREDRIGLDNARNRGIMEARHELIAFTDDDVRVDREWLRGIAYAFADPDVGAVTGLVAPALLDTEARQLFELVYGGMGKGTVARNWTGDRMKDREKIDAHHIGVGANMAFRRELLLTLNGFDPSLDVGTPARGAGDIDMFHRILVAGRTIRYEPRALAWHRHRADLEELHGQLWDNGRSFGVHLLRRFREGQVSRFATLRVMFNWMRWHAGRIVSRYRGRERMPLPLIVAEVAGAVTAPFAFMRTYRSARAAERLTGR